MSKGIIAVLLSLLLTNVAQAYDWARCNSNAVPLTWRPSIAALHINTTSFPAGSALRSKLLTAAGKWGSGQAKSNFNFVTFERSAPGSFGDGYNDVYFANLPDGVLGTTRINYDCYSNQWKILETDIIF